MATPAKGATPAAAAIPVDAAGRFQIGPSIDKLLAIPTGLDSLTPLQAADCFLKSEEWYVERALRVACELETRLKFHAKLNKTVLTEQEIALLFINLQQIYAFNKKLYHELLKIRLHGDIVNGVGQIMLTHSPFFKLYAGYIKESRKAQAYCDVLVTGKKKFLSWLDLNELCAGYSLKTLLLAPVSRMPQYLIFLGAIVRSLDPTSEAARKILQALTALSQVSDDIANALKDEVSRKLVFTIQTKVFGGNCSLVSPHRFVIKHSDLRKLYNKSMFGGSSKVYLFILFNDCLVYGTRPGKLSSGVLKHVLPLLGMTVEEESDDEKRKVKNGFKVNSNTKSFICCAINGPMKQSWIKAIRDQVNLANASASTLQKGQQAADAFERMIKGKMNKGDEVAMTGTASTPRMSVAGAGVATAQIRTTIPIQHGGAAATGASTTNNSSSSSHSSGGGGSANNHSYNSQSYSQSPPPPSADPSYPAPPPPPKQPPMLNTAGGGMPPPPPPMTPNQNGGGMRPPPPPMTPSNAGGFGNYNNQHEYSTSSSHSTYDNHYNDEPATPVVGAAAPPPPPMSAPSPPGPPKMDLMSQIKAGKTLNSSAPKEPDWLQILDPSTGAYYYEHKITCESTWDVPEAYVGADGTIVQGQQPPPPMVVPSTPSSNRSSTAQSSSPVADPRAAQDQLKQTLDRYRQFVQDEEDDVGECGDDEWD